MSSRMGNKQHKYELVNTEELDLNPTFKLSQELSSWPQFRCDDKELHRVGIITDLTFDDNYVRFTVAHKLFTIRRKLYPKIPPQVIINYIEQFAQQYVNITYRIEYLALNTENYRRPLNIEPAPITNYAFEITAIDNKQQDRTIITVMNDQVHDCVLLREHPNYGELYKLISIGDYVKLNTVVTHIDNNGTYHNKILDIKQATLDDVMSYSTIRITALIHGKVDSQYEIVGTHKGDPFKKRYLVDKEITTDVELLGYYSIGFKTIDNTWRRVLSIERKKSK